jgi:hypothetical protein
VDLNEKFARRVSEQRVADVLALLATLPGRRRAPLAADIRGNFDFWFDGGAAKIHTGYIDYELTDGTRASVGEPVPALSLTIQFADGSEVDVQQVAWGPAA